jgi:hypothetical protein
VSWPVPGGTQLQPLQQTLHILLHIWFFQLLPQRTTQLDGQSAASIDQQTTLVQEEERS